MPNIPQEIETKIIRGVPRTLAEFAALMRKVGASSEVKRRLLSDRRFRLKQSRAIDTTLDVTIFINPEYGKNILEFLGLTVRQKNNSFVLTAIQGQLPRRVVRLRFDGDKIILTIKEMLAADHSRGSSQWIKQRGEVEAELKTTEPIEKLFKIIGYKLSSHREKYRTTYSLDGTLIEWQEAPQASRGVPPWMEVEGPNVMAVEQTVKQLGFSPSDTAAISDAEYLHRSGVSNKHIKHLTFGPINH